MWLPSSLLLSVLPIHVRYVADSGLLLPLAEPAPACPGTCIALLSNMLGPRLPCRSEVLPPSIPEPTYWSPSCQPATAYVFSRRQSSKPWAGKVSNRLPMLARQRCGHKLSMGTAFFPPSALSANLFLPASHTQTPGIAVTPMGTKSQPWTKLCLTKPLPHPSGASWRMAELLHVGSSLLCLQQCSQWRFLGRG